MLRLDFNYYNVYKFQECIEYIQTNVITVFIFIINHVKMFVFVPGNNVD